MALGPQVQLPEEFLKRAFCKPSANVSEKELESAIESVSFRVRDNFEGAPFFDIQLRPLAVAGGGAGDRQMPISQITITKLWDSATPSLHLACADGRMFETVTMDLERDGAVGTRLVMTDVLIASLATSMGELESMALSFDKCM